MFISTTIIGLYLIIIWLCIDPYLPKRHSPPNDSFSLRKSHQAEAVAAPGSPVPLGEGILPIDELILLGGIYKLEKFIENLLKQTKKTGKKVVSKKILEDLFNRC